MSAFTINGVTITIPSGWGSPVIDLVNDRANLRITGAKVRFFVDSPPRMDVYISAAIPDYHHGMPGYPCSGNFFVRLTEAMPIVPDHSVCAVKVIAANPNNKIVLGKMTVTGNVAPADINAFIDTVKNAN